MQLHLTRVTATSALLHGGVYFGKDKDGLSIGLIFRTTCPSHYCYVDSVTGMLASAISSNSSVDTACDKVLMEYLADHTRRKRNEQRLKTLYHNLRKKYLY